MVVCGEYEVGGQQHGGFVVFNGNLPAVRADHGGANLPLAQQDKCPAGGALHGDVFARFVMLADRASFQGILPVFPWKDAQRPAC